MYTDYNCKVLLQNRIRISICRGSSGPYVEYRFSSKKVRSIGSETHNCEVAPKRCSVAAPTAAVWKKFHLKQDKKINTCVCCSSSLRIFYRAKLSSLRIVGFPSGLLRSISKQSISYDYETLTRLV
jgi:hypothetical protein